MKITHLPFDGEFKVTWRYGADGKASRVNTGTADNKHHGIDLIGISSKDIYSTSEGIVQYAGWDPSGFGNYVMIKSGKYSIYFAHLSSIAVKVGQHVTYSTKLGVMGGTGNVQGAHLHYEIRLNGQHINPTEYMGIPNVEGNYNSKNYMIELKKSNVVQAQNYVTYIIKANKTNVRPTASIFNKPIRELNKGNEISVFGFKNGFLKTDIGYVHSTCAYKK